MLLNSTKYKIKFRLCIFCIITFMICFNSTVTSQTLLRSTLSSFSSITINDSLKIASGQTMNTESNSPKVSHGYYPLNHSLLNTNEFYKNETFVYPNPFNESVSVEINFEGTHEYFIQIFSINGALILTETHKSNSFVLSTNQLSKGIYLLNIVGENGELIVKKIVKQ